MVKATPKPQKDYYTLVTEDPIELAYQYLLNILSLFPIENLKIEKKPTEDGAILSISGDDLGNIIGKHGVTLDSLQYLVNLVANNQCEDYFRIKIDVSNYRWKREKALETLGSKVAKKVIKTHRKFPLEPMNPYDRRIVHMAVKKYKGVESVSQGDGIKRHIVVVPVENIRSNNNSRRPAMRV
jgi:spoIIIJ-associated protein